MGRVSARREAGELAAELRAAGLRATSARLGVLAALASLGHATPDALHDEVSRSVPGVNLSSVYRTLDALGAAGLVRHAHLSAAAPSYYRAETADHAHLVCDACGGVEELGGAALTRALAALTTADFTPDAAHLAVRGRCRTCRDKHPTPSSGS